AAASTRAVPRSPRARRPRPAWRRPAGVRRCGCCGPPRATTARATWSRRGRVRPMGSPEGPGGLQAALPRELYVDADSFAVERDRVLYGEWFCVGRRADLGLHEP